MTEGCSQEHKQMEQKLSIQELNEANTVKMKGWGAGDKGRHSQTLVFVSLPLSLHVLESLPPPLHDSTLICLQRIVLS